MQGSSLRKGEPLDAWTITPPNIRSMLVPDPGYVFLEGDLARADAQVCAWDADCADLKVAFQRGTDIHTENASLLYGSQPDYRHTLHVNGMSFRDNGKRAVHAVDYAVGYRTLAANIAVSERVATNFIHYWTRERHPEIGAWHDRYERAIRGHSRPVARNAFGFHRVYTDRTDHLLSQYLAWICQSTVAVVINKGLRRIDCAEEIFGRPRCGTCVCCRFGLDNIRYKLQIHDSILCIVRPARLAKIAPAVKEALEVTVPYHDPLVIPADLKFSERSFGHMEEYVP